MPWENEFPKSPVQQRGAKGVVLPKRGKSIEVDKDGYHWAGEDHEFQQKKRGHFRKERDFMKTWMEVGFHHSYKI